MRPSRRRPLRQQRAILLTELCRFPNDSFGRPAASRAALDAFQQSSPVIFDKQQKGLPAPVGLLLADQRLAGFCCGDRGSRPRRFPVSRPTAPAFPAASCRLPAADRRSDHAAAKGGPARIPSSPASAGSRPSGAGAAASCRT